MKKHAMITMGVILAMLFAGGLRSPLFAAAIPAEHATVVQVEQHGRAPGVEGWRGVPREHGRAMMAPGRWGP